MLYTEKRLVLSRYYGPAYAPMVRKFELESRNSSISLLEVASRQHQCFFIGNNRRNHRVCKRMLVIGTQLTYMPRTIVVYVQLGKRNTTTCVHYICSRIYTVDGHFLFFKLHKRRGNAISVRTSNFFVLNKKLKKTFLSFPSR